MPQRRTSRTSSTNTVDGGGPAIIPPTFDDEVVPYNTSAIFSEIDDVISIAKGIVSPATVTSTNTDSNGATKDDDATSAATATVTTTTTSKEKEIVNTSDNTESRDSFHSANQNEDRPISSSPSLGLGDAFNHVTDNFASVGQTATDIPGLNGNANDIAMNLFIEGKVIVVSSFVI